MLGNRNIRSILACGLLLLPCSLLVMACGGKEDAPRVVGDSDIIPKKNPLQNCEAEAALEAELDYISEFVGTSAGWGASPDGSPVPPSAAGAIYNTCPADSSFDCCQYEDDQNWSVPPEDLASDDLRARVKAERKLNKTYRCAPRDAKFVAAIKGSSSTQEVDEPIPCAKYKNLAKPNRAFHVRAARLTDWGANIYHSFPTPRDASEFDGLSFWVRLGQGGTQTVGKSIFVAFEDVFTKEDQLKFKLETDPETGEYLMQERPNGDLEPVFALDELGNRILEHPTSSPGAPAFNCYDVGVDNLKCDRFGAGVGLEPEWRFVKLPFSKLRQRGFGVKSPAGRVLREALLAVSIYVDVGNWDFWIDQVAFYKEPKKSK